MRKLLLLLSAAAVAPVWADPAGSDPALAAVADLGRVNGLALACGQPDVAARAKAVMLAHVPKTRAFGEAYEAATSEAYTKIAGGCPDGAALRVEAELVATRIQAALPADK